MDVPTHKPLLENIAAGTVSVGLIPCPPDRLPAVGDKVTFLEADFEHLSDPTLVPQGSSVAATLTSVYDTDTAYRGSTLCTLRWTVGETPLSHTTPLLEELAMAEDV